MSDILLSLAQAQLAYGHHPLLDHADLTLLAGERIGLIGRNGAGKSSLLRVLDGRVRLDDGEIRRRGGLRIATVEQEPALPEDETVLGYLSGDPLATEDWQRSARAGALIDALGLDPGLPIRGLSGGTRKRVALAHALVQEPDLLLLDEPTNHLDFAGIAWLENLLRATRAAVVLITHDRRFLDAVATRIVELDRGRLLSFPGNFSAWQARKAQWLDAEQQANARFDKLLSQEEVWIRKGIEARRTRNEGRVRRLEALRRERAARRDQQGQVRFSLADGQRSGKLVAELKNVTHGYDDRILIRDFSTLIQRGDRIGLIGPNGAGKTTLLRILLGELQPLQGSVRLGTNLSIGYFDQMRDRLDESATLADTISPGSEWVEIGGQRKHVMSYLEDFLFPAARAHSPVSSLSGGERARLALARMFAQPHNVLVLDEPTNDLDIDTLELLEGLLQDYQGTVLLVSHDRTFLDNVVTQTIAAEGDGRWQEYVGGYDDWEAQRPRPAAAEAPPARTARAGAADTAKERPAGQPAQAPDRLPTSAQTSTQTPAPASAPAGAADKPRKNRLAPWEAEELAGLPDRISALEAEQAALAARLSDPGLYSQGADEAQRVQQALGELEGRLEALFERWTLLEDKRGD
ncbi:ATP-binding cassette domain-containing protein [Castellaniella defragrans]|nr:ATP-binding cassette domain-containing protein [Castellaniella defragrans]KAB0611058.1 ATP-binding cassette domain-containing protein [Castellaniella defragrans]